MMKVVSYIRVCLLIVGSLLLGYVFAYEDVIPRDTSNLNSVHAASYGRIYPSNVTGLRYENINHNEINHSKGTSGKLKRKLKTIEKYIDMTDTSDLSHHKKSATPSKIRIQNRQEPFKPDSFNVTNRRHRDYKLNHRNKVPLGIGQYKNWNKTNLKLNKNARSGNISNISKISSDSNYSRNYPKNHYRMRKDYPKVKQYFRKNVGKMRKLKKRIRVKNKTSKCNRLTHVSCNLKCISSNEICDGVRDCSDGRDEKNCNELQIGLYGGKKKGEGRVEMTMNGFRGTLCAKGWTDKDASVYCKMLGYRNGAKAALSKRNGFGLGSGLVWSTKFNCQGDEEDLFECPLSKRQIHCPHRLDAGVICRPDIQPIQPSPTTASNHCGVKSIKHHSLKILGGQTATYGSQPWQARLVLKKNFRHLCGASIIDEKWIITAAHCFKTVGRENVAVIVGDHSLTAKDGKEQVFGIEKMFVHPMFKRPNSNNEHEEDYYFEDFFDNPFMFVLPFKGRSYWSSRATASSFKNDIALLKLESYNKQKKALNKIDFNDHIQPICLPDENTVYQHGLMCEISGWGYSGKNKKGSIKLQVAKLFLIRQDYCEKAYGPMFFHKLPAQMVCAGSARGGNADTCQGDSGGPLACKVNGVYTLMGVTSWGFECGESVAPGIYTKVGVLRAWIDNIKQEN